MSVQMVEVYPRLGTTVPDAEGTPITSAGAIVPVSKYILDLLRGGKLLTWDPLNVYQPDGPREPVENGGGALDVLLDPQLSTPEFEPSQAGIPQFTAGINSIGDVPGEWYYDASSVATANQGLCRAPASGVGRWIRRRDRDHINVKWFGARGDGSTDDTAAIQAAIDATNALSSEVYFPRGHYVISGAGLYISQNKSGLRLMGESGASNNDMGVYLQWNALGPTDGGSTTLLHIVGSDVLVKNIAFVNPINGLSDWRNRICGHGCALGLGAPGTPHYATRGITFEDCKWVGFRNGVTFDRDGVSLGNIDYVRFDRCTWYTFGRCMYIHGGQAYGTVLNNCSMWGVDPTGAGRQPYGEGIYCDVSSGTSIAWYGGTIAYLAIGVWSVYSIPIGLYDIDSENVKQMVRVYDFSGAGRFCTNMVGGRLNFGTTAPNVGYRYTTSGQTPGSQDVPASEHEYIQIFSSNLNLVGVSFEQGYTPDTNFRIRVGGETNLTSRGCFYPNVRPFLRTIQIQQDVGTGALATPAGTWSEGDFGCQTDPALATRPMTQMVTLNGTENPSGVVTISGAATAANVVFDRAEPILNVGDLTSVVYRVTLTPEKGTGTPTMSMAYVTNKTNTGFTINLASAPGIGNTVKVYYELFR